MLRSEKRRGKVAAADVVAAVAKRSVCSMKHCAACCVVQESLIVFSYQCEN